MEDKEKIKNIIYNVSDKSNNDLIKSRDLLLDEYNKTKDIIIELTHHLDNIEESYNIINNELGKRIKK